VKYGQTGLAGRYADGAADAQPWHEALANPGQAQAKVLKGLLHTYAQTEYGAQHGAGKVSDIDGFRQSFPVVDYETVKPVIKRVMSGDVGVLLNEDPVGWASPGYHRRRAEIHSDDADRPENDGERRQSDDELRCGKPAIRPFLLVSI